MSVARSLPFFPGIDCSLFRTNVRSELGVAGSNPFKAINLSCQPTGGSEHAMQALFLNPAAHLVKNYLCCAARRAI
ncbi:hypothetical protein Bra5_PD00795 (plasmid) [Rhizobium phaseoli Brasil 5]|nr:hypothetical protein Bra5_PD00795 [Rhizobium phaseoli Brasil 5]